MVKAAFGLACATVIAAEAYVVFVDRDDTFRIEGRQTYGAEEFASGGVVSQSFLMWGDGLNAVSVRLDAGAATTTTVQWRLWRGTLDAPPFMTTAVDRVESMDLRPGPQWRTLTFPRDATSHNRWYTLQLRLLDARPAPLPPVRVVVSRDNPDRGGALWLDEVRQPGSLYLRADRRGRTLYRKFLADAAPNLPTVLRMPAVQWAIAIAIHWALVVFAYAALAEAARSPSGRATP